ncbi:MAG: serine hydrolase domain-containing protein [Gemmatimonadales bacterium]
MRPLVPVVLSLVGMAAAATLAAQAPATPAAAPTRGVHDRAELEGFIDGLITAARADKHIAGVTVSVVKDGQLFFAKGYGWADVDRRIPVDPARTLFRIGSISKLFTWTAVMQLVEQGKLDLDRDINEYLDFKIPATYPEPITLRHVLSHTPGLEEDPRELINDSTNTKPMSEWLPAHIPARVRPPGTFSSYSNWATAAAGYIVQRVSGLSFDDYVEQHILTPLGMTQTTTRQPLPDRLRADMSAGYQWKAGRYDSKPFEYIVGAAPAGSISSSAVDMTRFMLAHLGRGAVGDVRILSEATADSMYTRIFTHDERLPGFLHGFYEQSSHGLRIFGHGGDSQWFHSDLALLPSENLGVFISTNTDKGSEISFFPFLNDFLDHYYPDVRPVVAPTEGAKAGARRYAGDYLFNRMNFSTWMKALSLAQALPVAATDDGALLLKTPFGEARMVSVDSMLFRDAESGMELAFRADDQGRITHGFLSIAPMMVMDRYDGLARPTFHRNLLGFVLVVFLAVLVAAVIRFFTRNSRELPGADSLRLGRRLMVVVALLQLVFVGIMAGLLSNPEQVLNGAPGSLKVAMALPVIGLLLTVGALVVGINQWRTGSGTFGARIRHGLVVLLALAFFWSLNTWNLLGWKL